MSAAVAIAPGMWPDAQITPDVQCHILEKEPGVFYSSYGVSRVCPRLPLRPRKPQSVSRGLETLYHCFYLANLSRLPCIAQNGVGVKTLQTLLDSLAKKLSLVLV